MKQFPQVPSPPSLLKRILEEPNLVAAIQSLEARALHQVIQYVGLEDSGEIISLATTDQLKQLFDEDLWRNQKPGEEEKFDADRFGLWLEIMLQTGERFVAEKLSEMDPDFLTLALRQQVLVIDLQALASHVSDSEDKALEFSLNHEFDQYCVISRHPESFDAVLAALIALDVEHHDFLTGVLERCCVLSSETIEENGGLYQVLTAEEQLASDLAFEREQRREKQGFVPPQTAAGFLSLARGEPEAEDFVTRSYFKNYEETPPPKQPGETPSSRLPLLLQEAEVLTSPRQTLLLEGAKEKASFPLIREALARLEARDNALFSQRMKELSYLANVLLSGCTLGDRSFRPAEAAEAVLATCNLGLEKLGQTAETMTDAIRLFRVGWNLLYREVILLTSSRLQKQLEGKGQTATDSWTKEQLLELARSLKSSIAAGRPWDSQANLDILDVLLPAGAVNSLKALMGECPSFQGRFISDLSQLKKAQAFLFELK